MQRHYNRSRRDSHGSPVRWRLAKDRGYARLLQNENGGTRLVQGCLSVPTKRVWRDRVANFQPLCSYHTWSTYYWQFQDRCSRNKPNLSRTERHSCRSNKFFDIKRWVSVYVCASRSSRKRWMLCEKSAWISHLFRKKRPHKPSMPWWPRFSNYLRWPRAHCFGLGKLFRKLRL